MHDEFKQNLHLIIVSNLSQMKITKYSISVTENIL